MTTKTQQSRRSVAMAQGAGLDPETDVTWHVAWAAWRAEKRARDGLQARGYSVLVPTQAVTIRHAGRTMLADRPIFPRYLFVGVPMGVSWYPILSSVAINGLITNNEQPVRIPTWIVRNLIQAQEVGAFDAKVEVEAFREGQKVRFVGGPLENFVGLIQRAPPGQRVNVLVEMFGQKKAFSVPLAQLAAAC